MICAFALPKISLDETDGDFRDAKSCRAEPLVFMLLPREADASAQR